MLLGSEHTEGHKSVPKKTQIPAAEALSHWQCLLPSPLPPTTFPYSPLLLPLPPHLLLFPLWPASVVCLGWLIIRDTKILLSLLPFLSAEMSHFLARALVAGPQPGDTLLFIAHFHPRRGESGRRFHRSLHTHTHWNSQHASTHIQIHQHIHTKTHAHTERKAKHAQAHTHTHFLAWF